MSTEIINKVRENRARILANAIRIAHKISSRNVRKRSFGNVRPAKMQISLRIRAVSSESSLGAFRIARDAK